MNQVFLDILIVLVAAKLAAEIAERLRIPAVVGEIVAGIAIGPSVLGLVGSAHLIGNAGEKSAEGIDVLHTLGELGVILLLLEVGMHMDLRELRAVGRSAMRVAVVGVVVPFFSGYFVAQAFGLSSNASLFAGAALAATSVGITARVFGDLRELASVEARTVLGAAVADDVIGLVILTVVVRIATGDGAVTAASVGGVIGVAVLFLVATVVLGALIVPRAFAAIDRHARSSSTLFTVALAFALGIASLASASNLAPIVGAFVAGLALGRSAPAQRIQRELTPIGHLFIPVFFLQIGIDTDVRQFVKPSVLGFALTLSLVAVVGKVIAGFAASRSGNRLLIGIGMIPRGEVGLIFAGVGLREGVLGENSYAALLLMVLGTTLLTPPLLTAQLRRVRRRTSAPFEPRDSGELVARTRSEWLHEDASSSPQIVLGLDPANMPPDSLVLSIALQAANRIAFAPSTSTSAVHRDTIEWISASARVVHPVWTERDTQQFIELLRTDSERAWAVIESTGVLEAAFPEIAATLMRKRRDALILGSPAVWPDLHRVRSLFRNPDRRDLALADVVRELQHPDRLVVAAFLLDAVADEPVTASALLDRLVLSHDDRVAIGRLVSEAGLLLGAAVRPDGLDENSVLRITAHLRDVETARALYVMTIVGNELESWERDRVDELLKLVIAARTGSTFAGIEPAALERVRDHAMSLVNRGVLRERIATAPVAYLLAEPAEVIARHVTILCPTPLRNVVRVDVRAERDGIWRVAFVARDQVGLLALVTGVLEQSRLDVIDANIATWADGAALQSFRVHNELPGLVPNAEALQIAVTRALSQPLSAPPVADAVISFDDVGSPWHTIAEVRATDRRGLLHALAAAFASSGVDVHAARIATTEGFALDRFDLTMRTGEKVHESAKAAVRAALITGVAPVSAPRRALERLGNAFRR